MDAGVFGAAEAGRVRASGGAALTSGRVYVSASAKDATGKDQSVFYRVDPSTPNWQTVDTSAVMAPGQWGTIAGADGERLVIRTRGQVLWAGVE